jgi:hypothetical protein
MAFPFDLPHLLHPPRSYKTIAPEHKHCSDYDYLRVFFFLFSRKALQSLAIDGDESYPVSTFQGNAIRYYHTATSIARTRSSSHCNVMDGCKITQPTPRPKLPIKIQPWFACLNNRPNWQWKNQAEASGLCSLNINYKPHTTTTNTPRYQLWPRTLRPSSSRSTTATSIVTRAPVTPTPCCSLSSLRDRKQSIGDTSIKPKVFDGRGQAPSLWTSTSNTAAYGLSFSSLDAECT